MYPYPHPHTHTHARTHARTHTNAHTHAHTHTHTHARTREHTGSTNLNLHNLKRAADRFKTDEDSSMKTETMAARSTVSGGKKQDGGRGWGVRGVGLGVNRVCPTTVDVTVMQN